MPRSSPIRLAAAASFAFSSLLPAQSSHQSAHTVPVSSTLPVTLPTAPPPPTQPLTPAQLPPRHADVTFANGLVTVSANNSSLNQILREISHLTGMKITGGVADERVFGQYGPDNPSAILETLLDGTGSNILFVQSTGHTPSELILTPRQGGPTPPNPNANSNISDESNDSQQLPVQQIPRPSRGPMPPSTFPASGAEQNNSDQSHPVASDPSSANAPTATDPSQPQSPNGVKTPQEIYDQLQQLRQQQQQQANPK